MNVENLRKKIPALGRMVYGRPLVYLDNAATSQKPEEVLDMQDSMSRFSNGNIHRAMHILSTESTSAYEKARERVRAFINAKSDREIIFTSGTTASINLVAESFSRAFVKEGDKIIISEAEHHSNIVPWQLACEKYGAELLVAEIGDDGRIKMEQMEKMLGEKDVRLVSICHISNVLGIVNPVKEIIAAAHGHGVPVMLDGAQGIVHGKVDVQDLDCDFYAFSGHKIYAPTGTGILYGKESFLEKMPPYMGGGDMVGTVTFKKTTYAELPMKFEAGTSNFIGQSCWTPALDFADSLYEDKELSEEIKRTEKSIIEFIFGELSGMDGVRVLGETSASGDKIPLFSISVDGVHPSDMAQIMDKMGVALRSGMMCSEPLLSKFGLTAVLRASFLPYNTFEEAEAFVRSFKKAVGMLR